MQCAHRVHTECQRPLSGESAIMMEKLAQAGEGGGCTPTPCHYIYHHSPYFISTLFVFCGVPAQNLGIKNLQTLFTVDRLVYCFDAGTLAEAEEKDSVIPELNEQNLPAASQYRG
jgi:hypothetical protein